MPFQYALSLSMQKPQVFAYPAISTNGRLSLTACSATQHLVHYVPLGLGRYEYGFVIDGEDWQADPGAILAKRVVLGGLIRF